MNNTTSNGPARKSLAQQIDRLEATVTGLGQGVRQAVREATGQAVQEAIGGVFSEVLLTPTVAAMLGAAQGPTAPSAATRRPAGWLSRLCGWAATLPGKACSALRSARNCTAA